VASGMCTYNVRIAVNSDLSLMIAQCIHAIGDRANGAVLDSLEIALKHMDVPTIRPRIEHAQIMNHGDIVRLGKTGGAFACFVGAKAIG
jgi:predicted amidohydrolase YtcJ